MRLRHASLLRLSIGLNLCVVLLCAVWWLGDHSTSARLSSDSSTAVRQLAAVSDQPTRPTRLQVKPGAATHSEDRSYEITKRKESRANETENEEKGVISAITSSKETVQSRVGTGDKVEITEKNGEALVSKHCSLFALRNCKMVKPRPHTAMRGTKYWVLYNFVRGEEEFACDASVTYTTHGDFTFVDNLEPLVDRWQGPVSFGMYAPGEDYVPTLKSIAYIRQCGNPLVKKLVTFHIVFDVNKVPENVTASAKWLEAEVDCDRAAPWVGTESYRKSRRMTYPVNVVRNVARETVMTHFVFPSDVELYPSDNVIRDFLAMIRRNDGVLCSPRPRVFVLSIFEVNGGMTPPHHKDQMTSMLKNGTGIPFHKNMCARCHTIPKAKEWTFSAETTGLSVFHVAKRHSPFDQWEPIYICTNEEPAYDERLTWEGKMDKMGQGYAMCLLDYDFMILDNAFLVHKPGIKQFKPDKWRDTLVTKQRRFVINAARVELNRLYGKRKQCILR